MSYRVIAPYVTLRVPDVASGKQIYHGFYAGGVLPDNVNQDDVERHLRKGMVEKVETPAPAAEEPAPAKPAKTAKAAA